MAYLILFGELPTREQKAKFVHGVTYHTMLHEQITYPLRAASAGTRTDGSDDRGDRRAVGLLPRVISTSTTRTTG